MYNENNIKASFFDILILKNILEKCAFGCTAKKSHRVQVNDDPPINIGKLLG
jgi:hypothetical protein